MHLVEAVGDAVACLAERGGPFSQEVRGAGVVTRPQDQLAKPLNQFPGLFQRHLVKVIAARDNLFIEDVVIEVADDGDRELVRKFQQPGDLRRHPSPHQDDEIEEEDLFESFGDSSVVKVVGLDSSQSKRLHDVVAPVPRASCLGRAGADDEENTECDPDGPGLAALSALRDSTAQAGGGTHPRVDGRTGEHCPAGSGLSSYQRTADRPGRGFQNPDHRGTQVGLQHGNSLS